MIDVASLYLYWYSRQPHRGTGTPSRCCPVCARVTEHLSWLRCQLIFAGSRSVGGETYRAKLRSGERWISEFISTRCCPRSSRPAHEVLCPHVLCLCRKSVSSSSCQAVNPPKDRHRHAALFRQELLACARQGRSAVATPLTAFIGEEAQRCRPLRSRGTVASDRCSSTRAGWPERAHSTLKPHWTTRGWRSRIFNSLAARLKSSKWTENGRAPSRIDNMKTQDGLGHQDGHHDDRSIRKITGWYVCVHSPRATMRERDRWRKRERSLSKNGRVECEKGGQVRLRVRTGTKPIGPGRLQQTVFSTAMHSDVGTLAILPGTKERGRGVGGLFCCRIGVALDLLQGKPDASRTVDRASPSILYYAVGRCHGAASVWVGCPHASEGNLGATQGKTRQDEQEEHREGMKSTQAGTVITNVKASKPASRG